MPLQASFAVRKHIYLPTLLLHEAVYKSIYFVLMFTEHASTVSCIRVLCNRVFSRVQESNEFYLWVRKKPQR